MHHCVAGYAHRCASGSCRIFSLRRNGERQLTLELAPATITIMQARGAFNRPANRSEQELLRLWRHEIQGRRAEGQQAAGS